MKINLKDLKIELKSHNRGSKDIKKKDVIRIVRALNKRRKNDKI